MGKKTETCSIFAGKKPSRSYYMNMEIMAYVPDKKYGSCSDGIESTVCNRS
jgi:hypothetical protein